jgi:hypothetical protein
LETEVFEDEAEVFEERPLPELFERSKRKKIAGLTKGSGESRKDEPRTPLDVKRTIETLDDRQPLPEAFPGEDDEPGTRGEEQQRTKRVNCSEYHLTIGRKTIRVQKFVPPRKTIRQEAKEEV